MTTLTEISCGSESCALRDSFWISIKSIWSVIKVPSYNQIAMFIMETLNL